MRIMLFICILLLSLALASCAKKLTDETNTGESVDTEIIQSPQISNKEQIDSSEIILPESMSIGEANAGEVTLSESLETDETKAAAAVLPETIGKEEPVNTNTLSIVYLGERITAPESYPGVPEIYDPVLNDCYLSIALRQQRSILLNECDDKDRQEIIDECERIHRSIEMRGNLPYPGYSRSTTGYALVDLDDDNSPELILLDDSSIYDTNRQTSYIFAIFSIRNGRVVRVDNGSFEFNEATILGADKTLYQCVDWRGAGYTELKALRLEAGMSELTTAAEIKATLSFAEGDVPAPYWMKIENGEESSITEDEFFTYYEQYRNPKESMTLNPVILYPDSADPWVLPHTEDEAIIKPVEYPQSYRGAPNEYKPQLDALYLLSERIRRGDFRRVSAYDSWAEGIGFAEFPHDKLGYAVADINNDGIPELLLGTIEELEESYPNSIFALREGKPVFVESFWSRSRGVISTDGIIYCVGSGSAAYTYLISYRLDKNADTLTELTFFKSDYSMSDEKPYFVQVVNGRNRYITEQEFSNVFEEYMNPLGTMNLTVIPISN